MVRNSQVQAVTGFNEKTLYDEIVKTWGEHGAHAEVYRALCNRVGVNLDANKETIEQMVRRIYAEEGSKMETIKRVRWELEGVDLIAAKRLVEEYI